MTSKVNETIGNLVKIAEQMIDNADAPKTASPEEVLNGLESIIAQLEQVAATIPAEQGATPTAAPEGSSPPAEPDAKTAELETKVKELSDKLALKDREEIAQEFAGLYSDSRTAQAKYAEVMKSTKSNEVLKTELTAIEEFAEKNHVTSSRHAKNETFSYVRTAQQSDDRLHTL